MKKIVISGLCICLCLLCFAFPQKQEKTIGEKAFIIEKQKERDLERLDLKPDIKGIGSKIESKIEKIEEKKKNDHPT